MEVNKNELIKQRREEMLKGKYALAEIIVSAKEPNYPSVILDYNDITLNELTILYAILGEIRKDMIEKYPGILIANNFYEFQKKNAMEIDRKENKERKNK